MEEKRKLLESLVSSMAKKYVGRGLEYEELYDIGISVVPKILEQYKDIDINLKIDCMPSWYIRQAITRGINERTK